MPPTNSGLSQVGPFGRLLKFWRNVHGVSQEELASRIDSAARHISRLEKGGASPSKEMVEKIARALSLGRRDTNHLLLFAGYTAKSESVDLSHPDNAVLRKKIIRNLMALDPLPTIVANTYGDVLMVNKGWLWLQRELLPEKSTAAPLNFYELALEFTERKLVPPEWEPTLTAAILSLEQQMLTSNEPRLRDLCSRLIKSPQVPPDWAQQAAASEPGRYFGVNISMEGEIQRFFVHSHHLSVVGPLGFSSKPDLIVMTFYPEEETLNCAPMMEGTGEHPLLFY